MANPSTPPSSRDVRPVVAAGLCVIAAILAWPLLRDDEAPPSAPQARPVATAPPRSEVAPPPAALRRVDSPPPSEQAAAPAMPAGADAAPAPKTGIALFPRPGTDPPKPGILVPDDYELPPGYVRHHQTTDDGQQLPAILMFHPDFQPVDDRGRPIPVPADRIVPPELAPPGLGRDVLQVPPTNVPFVEDPPARAAVP